ncbi:MAG: dicarboxylate/amino acid:cation symporter [Gammaproteobacteria bacterium]|nr:dicarboxylate/amino acid:cation symporter [Gammaproteobacteria bacterium]
MVKKNKKPISLHWKILFSLILAIFAGLLTKPDTVLWFFCPYDLYAFIGTLFMNGLRMLSVPLVIASMISGLASIGSGKMVGKLGVRTIGFYALTTAIAIIIGLFFINAVQPGYEINPNNVPKITDLEKNKLDAAFRSNDDPSIDTKNIAVDIKHPTLNIFYQLVPPNVFQAAADGQLMGLITFSMLFGYFILHTKEKHRIFLTEFWTATLETIMLLTMWFLRFAPYGIFALVAKSVAETGFSAFMPLIKFFLSVIAALAFHNFIVLSLFLYFMGGINPWLHIKAMMPAMLTAFSTSSSSASLPITIECVEKNAKVSNKITSFVLPLGASINMNGTALYEGMAVIFIAQAYGVHVSMDQQFIVLIAALLTSIGVAAIPSASLVAITILLTTIGLPLEGIGLLMITDRILDMCRTVVNVYGDTCGAVIIARNMGEKNVLKPA